ncbi:MAG: hypothetical protein Ct9H300mP11_16150 [Chloroflexota bacterium]|nr:MAG: hypothetical protein Ct9H300mP11_16150 [Chloroflexota bacterium]
MNRRTLESLAKRGGFDSLAPRGAVIFALDQMLRPPSGRQELGDQGRAVCLMAQRCRLWRRGERNCSTAPDVSDKRRRLGKKSC